jgi:hypothetical protein
MDAIVTSTGGLLDGGGAVVLSLLFTATDTNNIIRLHKQWHKDIYCFIVHTSKISVKLVNTYLY